MLEHFRCRRSTSSGELGPSVEGGAAEFLHTCGPALSQVTAQPSVSPPSIHRDLCAEKPPWQIPSQKLLTENKTQSQGLRAQGFLSHFPAV